MRVAIISRREYFESRNDNGKKVVRYSASVDGGERIPFGTVAIYQIARILRNVHGAEKVVTEWNQKEVN